MFLGISEGTHADGELEHVIIEMLHVRVESTEKIPELLIDREEIRLNGWHSKGGREKRPNRHRVTITY